MVLVASLCCPSLKDPGMDICLVPRDVDGWEDVDGRCGSGGGGIGAGAEAEDVDRLCRSYGDGTGVRAAVEVVDPWGVLAEGVRVAVVEAEAEAVAVAGADATMGVGAVVLGVPVAGCITVDPILTTVLNNGFSS
ncbi:hypothetical protein O6H91_05G087200 [Diphasiastrum complanatum]|uniref:Uncharacterized protein n=1 Tax=Diphasiastrum complanatum TaxID=34168 RepID=A0ACC2DQX2_DIPCM|nr:hypothetical protein O6H91_05G087200 [Diphasiastrum complanatum]